MSDIAIVFPGQGSQFVCMGKTFYDDFDAARKTYEEANDALGYDIARLSFEGPQSGLDRTENTQPALLTAGIAAYRALGARVQLNPRYFAGHSLGEYTALVAAGVIEFRDAVRLVRLRGKFMQESVPEGVGKMCAILGLGLEAVTSICDSASLDAARVVPANINTSEQIVISGHAAAVDIAAGLAKERGAKRVVPLPVSAPSHSPLMENAASKLDSELGRIRFSSFTAPVVTNVEAEPLTDPSRVRELLKLQLTSPVRWVDIIKRMRADGVGTVIEVGPGKVLTGLVKRIDKEINALSLSESGDMDGVLEALK